MRSITGKSLAHSCVSCAVSFTVDNIVGLGKEDAEKQYVLVVQRLIDIYGL